MFSESYRNAGNAAVFTPKSIDAASGDSVLSPSPSSQTASTQSM